MILRRETSPCIIDALKPYFTEDGDYTREIMAEEFKSLLIDYPSDIFVVVGYEEGLSGFILAFRPFNRNFVYLAQVYSRVDARVAQRGFGMLEDWARSLGVREIRASTQKNSVAMIAYKNYGFKEQCIEISKELFYG